MYNTHNMHKCSGSDPRESAAAVFTVILTAGVYDMVHEFIDADYLDNRRAATPEAETSDELFQNI